MKKFKFKCPKCGSSSLQEEQANAVVRYDVSEFSIDEDGRRLMEYEQDEVEGDEISIRFICKECGHALEGVTSEEDLFDWLKSNGEEEEE